MINRKIAMSGMSILASLALMGGATFAFFSDTATSTANVFSTGNLDLLLPASDTVTASFGGTNLAPGVCTGNQTLNVKNNGSLNALSLGIVASNNNGSMAPYLRINSLTFNGVPVVVPNTNGTAFSDLNDLQSAGATTGGITAGTTLNLVMDICLDTTAPNSLQSQTDTVELTFTLNQ